MKHNKSSISAAAAALLLLVLPAFIISAGPTDWDRRADSRKADYIYLVAKGSQEVAESDDAHEYHLFRRAFSLDSTQTDFGYDLAPYIFTLHTDQAHKERTLYLLRRHIEANPQNKEIFRNYIAAVGYIGTDEESIRAWEFADSVRPTFETGYGLASAYMTAGDSANRAKMHTKLESLIDTYGLNYQLAMMSVYRYMGTPDSLKSIDVTNRYIEEHPKDDRGYHLAASLYDNFGNDSMALDYLNKAYLTDTLSGTNLYVLGGKYLELGDSATYMALTKKAVCLPELETNTRTGIIIDFAQNVYESPELREQTDSILAAAVEMAPYEVQIQRAYAAYLAATGRFEQAIMPLRIALDADPENEEVQATLASVYVSAEQYNDAKNIIRNLIKTSSDSNNYKLYMVSVVNMADGPTAAIDTINRFLADSLPAAIQGDLYSTRASLIEQQGDPVKAREDYEKALAASPGNPLIQNNFAYSLAVNAANEADLKRAEELITSALAQEPDRDIYLDTYAWVLFKQKRYELALEFIKRALENSKDDDEDMSELFDHAGDIYFWNQMPDEAVEMWERALVGDPDNELIKRKATYKTYFYK